MEDKVVGQIQRRPNQSERDRRIEHHEVCPEIVCEVVDAFHHPRMRQQHRFTRAFNAIWLVCIERCGPFIGTCEDGKAVRRQPTPPFPEQRLDATDLRWIVVRDEKMLHVSAAARSSRRA